MKSFGVDQNLRKFFLFIITTQLLIACKPEIKQGLYSGQLTKNTDSVSTSEPVQSHLEIEKEHYGHLTVRNAKQEPLERIEIKWNHKNKKIKLFLRELSQFVELTPLEYFKNPHRMYCYHGQEKFVVSLCFGKDQFNLSLTDEVNKTVILSLNGFFDSQQIPLKTEPPRSFTRSQAIQLAFSQSFDKQIEYQILLAAKYKARAAWMNLLPHLNYKDLLGISSMVPRTVINFVADFIPFLLPTRWFQKNEAKTVYEAEKLTLDILRADLAYGVESLAFSLERDQLNDRFYKDEQNKLLKAHEHVIHIGQPDIGNIGTIADELEFRLRLVENFVRQDKNRLETSIDLGKVALAFQMGYTNPDVVQTFDSEADSTEIKQAVPLNKEEIVRLALQRSLELKQMDYLIMNGEYQKKEWYFNFADPDVTAASAVSLSLIPNLARAKAVVGELNQRRNKIAAHVKMNAANAVINYNRALELYKITQEVLDQIGFREKLLFDDIEKASVATNIRTNGAGVQYALSTYFQFKLKQNDAISAFQIAQAQIRRVLFEYYYKGIQPHAYGD